MQHIYKQPFSLEMALNQNCCRIPTLAVLCHQRGEDTMERSGCFNKTHSLEMLFSLNNHPFLWHDSGDSRAEKPLAV